MGVPELDSRALLAKLSLDGQQVILSWLTILKNSRILNRHSQPDPEKISKMGPADVDSDLWQRHNQKQLKIESVIKNAKGFSYRSVAAIQ